MDFLDREEAESGVMVMSMNVCVSVWRGDSGKAWPCVILQQCVQCSLEELPEWITLTGLTAALTG